MRRRVLTASLIAAALLCAGIARGEVSGVGSLRVHFKGGFSPQSLPRERAVPVTVHVAGAIRTTDGSRPPQLRRLTIALNRHGDFFTRGLPSCRPGLLQTTTTAAALQRCRGALVGHGSFGVHVDFSGASAFPAHGTMLAFNGRAGGRPAILFHLYGTTPVQATMVIPFKISHRATGQFGTVLSAAIPTLAGDQGYVTDIGLTIGRKFGYRGRRRSLISASCSAPAGFSGIPFDLAKGTFYFAGGTRLTTSLTRDCRVKG